MTKTKDDTSAAEQAFGFDPQKFMDMNPFGANPAKFFETWMDTMKGAQSPAAMPWAEFTRAPTEVAEFTMNRIRKTMELGATLATARTPNAVVEALSQASSAAVADYQEMAEKMLARVNTAQDDQTAKDE